METASFCHSHPLVTASVKVVTLEDRRERFLLKEKKTNTPEAHWRKLPWFTMGTAPVAAGVQRA